MPRPFQRSSFIHGKTLLYPLLMGTVAWFALRSIPAQVVIQPIPTSSTAQAQASSTTLVLVRPSPNQDRDERFLYRVEAGVVASTSSVVGFRAEPASTTQLTRRGEDGVWMLIHREESVVLRDERGTAYKDPLLVGNVTANTTALIATISDRRVLLAVAHNGSLHELARLSDQTSALGTEDGRVWFLERAPQEGIEVPPHGPSAVWSIDTMGVTSTRIEDARTDRLIGRVVALGPRVALETDQQDLRVFQEHSQEVALSGHALAWLPDHRLFLVHEGLLCLLDDQTLFCGPAAPKGITKAFLLHS